MPFFCGEPEETGLGVFLEREIEAAEDIAPLESGEKRRDALARGAARRRRIFQLVFADPQR
jgi:hypothetical protein